MIFHKYKCSAFNSKAGFRGGIRLCLCVLTAFLLVATVLHHFICALALPSLCRSQAATRVFSNAAGSYSANVGPSRAICVELASEKGLGSPLGRRVWSQSG